jgi:hypothetical protein
MGEHGVDSSGRGKGQIAGVFERGSEYTRSPPLPLTKNKLRSFTIDSEVVRFSKTIMLHGVCRFLFVCYLGYVV